MRAPCRRIHRDAQTNVGARTAQIREVGERHGRGGAAGARYTGSELADKSVAGGDSGQGRVRGIVQAPWNGVVPVGMVKSVEAVEPVM